MLTPRVSLVRLLALLVLQPQDAWLTEQHWVLKDAKLIPVSGGMETEPMNKQVMHARLDNVVKRLTELLTLVTDIKADMDPHFEIETAIVKNNTIPTNADDNEDKRGESSTPTAKSIQTFNKSPENNHISKDKYSHFEGELMDESDIKIGEEEVASKVRTLKREGMKDSYANQEKRGESSTPTARSVQTANKSPEKNHTRDDKYTHFEGELMDESEFKIGEEEEASQVRALEGMNNSYTDKPGRVEGDRFILINTSNVGGYSDMGRNKTKTEMVSEPHKNKTVGTPVDNKTFLEEVLSEGGQDYVDKDVKKEGKAQKENGHNKEHIRGVLPYKTVDRKYDLSRALQSVDKTNEMLKKQVDQMLGTNTRTVMNFPQERPHMN